MAGLISLTEDQCEHLIRTEPSTSAAESQQALKLLDVAFLLIAFNAVPITLAGGSAKVMAGDDHPTGGHLHSTRLKLNEP